MTLHALVIWWQLLSFSHAAIVLLVPLLLVGALICMLTPRPAAPTTRREDWSPWPLVDYSAQYRAKAAWLGPRYLLAKPINRRSA